MISTDVLGDTQVFAAESLARSSVYRLLSQAFAHPMRQGVEQLRKEDLSLALASAGPLAEDVRSALRETEAAFDRASFEELEAAFRGVFSHVHSVDCPPYETDYSAQQIWRQSQELADLAGFYRAFGMQEVGDRPDHISVELEYMHLVTYKAAWALLREETERAELCLRAQERFLGDHLLRWAPGFAARVVSVALDGPYAAAGRLLGAQLRSEGVLFRLPVTETADSPAANADAKEIAGGGVCEERT